MNKFALIVVDLQKDFIIANKLLHHQYDSLMKNVQIVIDQCVNCGISVCYIQDVHSSLDDKEFAFFAPHCIKNSGGDNLVNDLFPLKGKVFQKSTYSAFHQTDLHRYLISQGVSDIIIIGVQTHLCVLSTALHASMFGYKVYIVKDAVASTTPYKKKAALHWIEKYVGKVIGVEDLRQLFQGANGDKVY